MNGEATHEWRIAQLEQKVEKVEAKIQAALYLLVANLICIIGVLMKEVWLQ